MMKPFKLKEYLKDRNKEVVTREGKPVKILCTNLISDKPIIAEIIGEGYSLAYDVDGSHTSYQSPNDIFFKTKTKKKRINLYRSGDGSGVYAVSPAGISNIYYKGECALFPSKGQRDWSKFDINTLQPLDKVLVRDIDTDEWHLDLFSNMTHFDECACIGGCWAMAIPYNDDTKHLLGETIDCDEYYTWWENNE